MLMMQFVVLHKTTNRFGVSLMASYKAHNLVYAGSNPVAESKGRLLVLFSQENKE